MVYTCETYNRLLSVNVYTLLVENTNDQGQSNRELFDQILEKHYKRKEIIQPFSSNLFKRVQAATKQLYKSGMIERVELKTDKKTIYYKYKINGHKK